ncbi:MAG: 50S ribosomal protein L7/L12 [Treponemataceae bacterium]
MATLTNEQIIEAIEGKTILELSELIKAMEEKFGVTAAAPVAVVAGAAAPAAEEKTEFTVTLKGLADPGKKIAVIKEIRNLVPGLGLKEAKELVEGAPKVVKEDVSKEEANKIKEALVAAGADVEIA